MKFYHFSFSIIFALVTISSCKKNKCEKFYDRMTRCHKKGYIDIPKKQFLVECEEVKEDPVLSDKIECSVNTTCSSWRKCVQEKTIKRKNFNQLKKLNKLHTQKQYFDVVKFCDSEGNDDFRKRCKEILPGVCTDLFELAKAAKKAGNKDLNACTRLSQCSKLTGNDKLNAEMDKVCK
ncbi:hypothetical protein KKF34_06125 [Myxococcota bacterium]|nr:hypothetical protein [Myxococcota bacterium]MBU1383203.1 hypothetical protein [Myxococcota bacterium]MBU1496437.1 hypothetical protein [Myxococcota bacterium]